MAHEFPEMIDQDKVRELSAKTQDTQRILTQSEDIVILCDKNQLA